MVDTPTSQWNSDLTFAIPGNPASTEIEAPNLNSADTDHEYSSPTDLTKVADYV